MVPPRYCCIVETPIESTRLNSTEQVTRYPSSRGRSNTQSTKRLRHNGETVGFLSYSTFLYRGDSTELD
jgi:hypothetical protein